MDETQASRLRAWIVQAQQGDQEAFTRLMETFAPDVYTLAVRYLGDPQEAQDVVQETFLRAYMHLWRVDPARPFKTWLATIAIRLCIDRLRQRRAVVSGDALPYEGVWFQSPEPTPEEVAVQEETYTHLHHLVRQLPPLERAAIVLHYWEGYSLEAIAEVLHRSVPAVKSLLFRARKRLQRWWNEPTPPQSQSRTP